MSAERLRERIVSLLARLPGLGIESDICVLSIVELRGLYCFLSRIKRTSRDG